MRRRDRHDHLRGDVHVIRLGGVELDDLIPAASGDTLVDEASVLVERLVRLSDRVIILDVRGHVLDLVGNDAGSLVYLAVRRLDEAVIIYPRICRKVRDKTDVRTFRRLDRAHTSVMRIVYVADLEGRAVTGQTARAECRKTALMRQLRQRVVLVHELGQRRRAEELADSGNDRSYIDERIRRERLGVLSRHALLDRLVHLREADAHLVLEKLSDRTKTAVSEVVDIVSHADIVREAGEIVDRREDIVLRDMLRNELRDAICGDLLELVDVPVDLTQDLEHDRKLRALGDADVLEVAADDMLRLDHTVAEDLDLSLAVVEVYPHLIDAGVLNGHRLLHIESFLSLEQQLAGDRGNDRSRELPARDPLAERELLVVLITSDCREIIALRVEEQIIEQQLCRLDERRLARTQLLVDLLERLIAERSMVLLRLSRHHVLLHRGDELWILTEILLYLLVRLDAERTDEDRHRDLAVLIYPDIEYIVRVGLVLEPRAAVRDDGRRVDDLTRLVDRGFVIYSGGADDLGYDDALRTVDDEGAVVGHKREIAHEDRGLLDLAGGLVGQADRDSERSREIGVALLALLLGVLRGRIDGIVDELDDKVARVVGDRRNVVKNFSEPFVEEPLIRLFLHLDEIGHFQSIAYLGEAHSFGLAKHRGFDHH